MRCALVLFALLSIAPPTPAGEVLRMAYFERPPYYLTAPDGVPAGFLVERTRQIALAAGVELALESLPASRILAEMENGGAPLCSIGWFATPERRAFARFTLPIYRSQPQQLVAAPEVAARIETLGSMRRVADQADLIPGIIQDFSYGPALDALLRDRSGPVAAVRVSPAQLLRMVAGGRMSYTFVDPDEWGELTRAASIGPGELETVGLPDIPAGNPRHLMCSRNVDAGIIARLDAAIGQLHPDLAAAAVEGEPSR